MSKGFGAIALTGGGTGALDAIDGNDLTDGDVCVVTTDSGVYHYHLDASSGASENSPYVVSPDSNAGTKRWILVMPMGPFSHVYATNGSAQSISNTTNTTFIAGTEVRDTLSEYVHTTGVFTALYSGIYLLNSVITSASVAWASNTGWEVLGLIDSTTIIRGNRKYFDAGQTDYAVSSISCTIELAATETIEVQINHNQGGAVNTRGSAEYCWLTIDRIA